MGLMATGHRDCIYLLRTHSVHDAKACFQREKKLAGREKCRLPLHSLESASVVGTPALVHSFPLAWEKGLVPGPCRSPQHASGLTRLSLSRRRGKAQALIPVRGLSVPR